MAKLIEINTYHDKNGILAVLESPVLPFEIKRVFWIYNNSSESVRGRHRHKKSTHLLVCMVGSCKIYVKNKSEEKIFILNSPNKILLLEPTDWREMYSFSENCVLSCFSDELYDPNDYILTPYIINQSVLEK